MTFGTNGNVFRAIISSDGNLGIGTAVPSGRLHVNNAGTGIIVANDQITGNAFEVHGAQGNLFTITDDLSDSLMSVNDAAGMPVFEVFADDTIKSYRNNETKFEVDPDNNRIRLRDDLYVSGNSYITGNLEVGSAELGDWPSATDYAFFGHKTLDHSNAANYAVLQASAGDTYLNAAAEKKIYIRIGNAAAGQAGHEFNKTTTIFNSTNIATNFRVDGNTVDYQLDVNATNHCVGIGAAADTYAKMRIMATATNGSPSSTRPFINFVNNVTAEMDSNSTNIDTDSTASNDHAHAGWLLIAVNNTNYYLQLYAS